MFSVIINISEIAQNMQQKKLLYRNMQNTNMHIESVELVRSMKETISN